MSSLVDDLANSYVLISCEGGAEDTIVRMLLDAGALCIERSQLIDITRLRSADDIARQFLGFDYDKPVALLYITDSLRSRFELTGLYRDTCDVFRLCTRPEIEILTVINENRIDDYRKSNLKPSEFCKQRLRMKGVKRPEVVRQYWTLDSLVGAIREYARIHHFEKGECSLADILDEG